MKLFGKRLSGSVDVTKLKVQEDGTVEEPCWFCGGTIITQEGAEFTGVATVSIETLGDEHGRMHGVCHTACAERAHGSVRA